MPEGVIPVIIIFVLTIAALAFFHISLRKTVQAFANGFDRDWPVEGHFFFNKKSGHYRGKPISAWIDWDDHIQVFWVELTTQHALSIHLVEKQSRISGYGPPIWFVRDEFPKPLMIKHDCQAAFDEWVGRHDPLFRSFIEQFNLAYLNCEPNRVRICLNEIPATSRLPLLWQLIEALLDDATSKSVE